MDYKPTSFGPFPKKVIRVDGDEIALPGQADYLVDGHPFWTGETTMLGTKMATTWHTLQSTPDEVCDWFKSWFSDQLRLSLKHLWERTMGTEFAHV